MNIENLSFLDKLRSKCNSDVYKYKFKCLLKDDKRKAVNYLNENNLQFPTLFLLISDIQEYELISKLSWRNKLAIKVCNIILNERKPGPINNLESGNKIYQVLQWMFGTGYIEDGLNDDYDQVLDGIVALLIMKYRNHDILPTVVEMIFERNRKGMLIHDLTWSFFNSYNPITLKLVAEFLQSTNQTDHQLVNKLLHIEPEKFHIQEYNHIGTYEAYKKWLTENHAYLYFTNESFQLTSDPVPCKINIEAKYLNKKISPDSGKFKKSLSSKEKKYLQHFEQMSDSDKQILSNYSNKIYQMNINSWRKWIGNDIGLQIQNVRKDLEGER